MIKTMALVTIFSCIERLLGFVYRIFLSRVLGAEGVGIYQVSLSVVGLLMTLTASGIPITVSRLMVKHSSERNEETSYKTVTAGILFCLVISVPIVSLLWFFPDAFSFIFADERCMSVLRIMLPGIVITSLYAVIRGYFWGKKKFFTYSAIELLEEIVMLVAGVILVRKLTDTLSGVKYASYAVLISYIFSFITAVIFFFIHKGKFSSPVAELKPLIRSSTPITIMRTTTSVINTLVAVILPVRLMLTGLTNSQAISQFGELTGMSIPLISIPSTLIGSIALVLVPELSSNYYTKNYITLRRNIEEAVKCSVFISSMIIPTFLSMGREIGIILYDNEQSGIYVSIACLIMFPMSITMITTSMLNSLNKERKTLLFYLIGATFLVLSIYFLPKYIGVYALIVGLFLSYLTTSILNLILLSKTCKSPPRYLTFIITSALFLIPTALLGYLLKGILIPFVGKVVGVIISSLVIVVYQYLFYKIFDVYDVKRLFKK